MLSFIRDGGAPILFVIAFGLWTLASSLSFAVRPGRARLASLKWMHLVVLFSTLSGTFGNIGAVFHYLGDGKQGKEDRVQVLLTGLGESMSTPILGFAFLALSALGMAVGLRRLPPE
ncbi:MAG: hypothetical protein U0174_05010 [Polyangiaceae bacterium]